MYRWWLCCNESYSDSHPLVTLFLLSKCYRIPITHCKAETFTSCIWIFPKVTFYGVVVSRCNNKATESVDWIQFASHCVVHGWACPRKHRAHLQAHKHQDRTNMPRELMSACAVSAVSSLSPSLSHTSVYLCLTLPTHTPTHKGVNMTYKPTYFQPQLKLHSQHCATAVCNSCCVQQRCSNPDSMLWLCSNPLTAPQTSMLSVTHTHAYIHTHTHSLSLFHIPPLPHYRQPWLPWLLLPWQPRSRPATGGFGDNLE